MSKRPNGFGLIEFILLLLSIAIISGIVAPSLKHHKKRVYYRDILDIANPLTSIVEKCLGIERVSTSCHSLDQLIPYGYSPTQVEVNSIIDTIELELKNETYHLSVTPSVSNDIHPFITDEHTYNQTAEIIDRNGRPIIEDWVVDPTSGCKIAGLC